LVVQILYNRGIYEESEVYDFIQGSFADQDPFKMKDMAAAVERILKALDSEEQIVVYGDYDADGVTATVLLVQALRAFGAQVTPYIPNRFEEGYGLNKEAIAELAQRGTALIITVDCGIRSIDEVKYGLDLGLHFIITDHHQIAQDQNGRDQLPPAAAVINPKRADCTYPFKDFAGVGLAFKLVQGLRQALADQSDRPAPLCEADLLDLVALGTVADMAPLIGENRALVRAGLMELNRPRRLGLAALINKSSATAGRITAGTIGFILGPRLNAAGRLTHARLAYKLLTTENPAEAQHLAGQLDQINVERQALTQRYVDQARNQITASGGPAPLHLIVDAEFNEGVVGLVASRLTEEFYRPVAVNNRLKDRGVVSPSLILPGR
jgi:single-stranded-DNA-specific exonuclease